MKRSLKLAVEPSGVSVLSLDLDDPYLAPDAVWRSGRAYTQPYVKDGTHKQRVGSVELQPITIQHVHAPAKRKKRPK